MAVMILPWMVSCDDDDAMGTPVFTKVSPIKDLSKTINSGSMGDWIAIQGENLSQATTIRFNDVEVDMQEVYKVDSALKCR